MAIVSTIDLKRGRIESTALSGCCRQGEEAGLLVMMLSCSRSSIRSKVKVRSPECPPTFSFEVCCKVLKLFLEKFSISSLVSCFLKKI
jgi:hypothetical protein